MFKDRFFSYFLLFLFVFANLMFWSYSKNVVKPWSNVPQAPLKTHAVMTTLGDKQLAYRFYAMMLQNFGSVGGQYVSLKEYDYSRLQNWFLLEDYLDPVSDAVPMMAAYYYGAVMDDDKQDKVLDYLAVVGARPEGNKWRWLAHAVYLAQHEQENNDRALELAYILAENKNPNMSDWAKQMPVFILRSQGETELAYDIMLNILVSNVDTLHPNEINYMTDYICNTLLKELPNKTPPPFCE